MELMVGSLFPNGAIAGLCRTTRANEQPAPELPIRLQPFYDLWHCFVHEGNVTGDSGRTRPGTCAAGPPGRGPAFLPASERSVGKLRARLGNGRRSVRSGDQPPDQQLDLLEPGASPDPLREGPVLADSARKGPRLRPRRGAGLFLVA